VNYLEAEDHALRLWQDQGQDEDNDSAILATLNNAVNDTIKTPQVHKELTDLGFDPIVGSQAQAVAMFNAEIDKRGKMVKALGLSIK
jgi:tripartite-type tricarboxylate transporter receptor subunit TctC